MSAASLHVIPVPRGWSVEQAWEAISRGDLLSDEKPSWSVVRVESGVFVEVVGVCGDAEEPDADHLRLMLEAAEDEVERLYHRCDRLTKALREIAAFEGRSPSSLQLRTLAVEALRDA